MKKEKEKEYTGYAVVSKEVLNDRSYKAGKFTVYYQSYNLEACKNHCEYNGIIVRTYKVLYARYLQFHFYTKHACAVKNFHSSYWPGIDLGFVRIDWGNSYVDGFERKIIYSGKEA